jgi:hypothetical protein
VDVKEVAMRNVAIRAVAVIALGTLALAGCGDDDSSDGEPSSSAGSAGSSGSSGSGGQGSAGKGGSTSGSNGSGASSSGGDAGEGGECIAEGGDCEPGSNACCEGVCIESETGEFSGCRPLCQDASDCDSGCCQPFTDAGGGFCVDAAYCSCVEQDGACGPSVESACCEGSTCAITEGPYLCHQICVEHQECPEECCVPLGDTGDSICSPAEFCL